MAGNLRAKFEDLAKVAEPLPSLTQCLVAERA